MRLPIFSYVFKFNALLATVGNQGDYTLIYKLHQHKLFASKLS